MTTQSDLRAVRAAFFKRLMAATGVADARVEEAFVAVPREDYLGPGPWPILRGQKGYVPTPSADPVHLYEDVFVGIIPRRGLNNGAPSRHAKWIAAAAPKAGEHVLHVGAGVGYYTAILAHLVGPTGRVTGIEYDPELAERARVNLARWPNVRLIQGDGAKTPFDPADVIYVSAGATRPEPAWVDGLKDGGRLQVPLTTNANFRSRDAQSAYSNGAYFQIQRHGDAFSARLVQRVIFIPAEGLRDEVSEAALAEAFARGGIENVTRLYRTDDIPPERCWAKAPGWALAYS